MSDNEWKKWLIERKSYWWWVPDVTKLDEESILEAIMNFGKWSEFLTLKELWGREKLRSIFTYMVSKRRVNLRPEKIALFGNYFAKYAQSTQ